MAHIHAEQGASSIDTDDVYNCFERGIILVNEVLSFLLHLRLIIHVIGSGFNDGGPVFLALCILPPIVKQFTSVDLWTKGAIADVDSLPRLTSSRCGE